jgi:hypothetical protein
MTLDENPIPQMVAAYRKLKARRDSIDAEMKAIREELRPVVEANGGKWEDRDGYARIVTCSESVTYPSKFVETLVTAWAMSEDTAVQTCADTLLVRRQEKAGYSYLQVK